MRTGQTSPLLRYIMVQDFDHLNKHQEQLKKRLRIAGDLCFFHSICAPAPARSYCTPLLTEQNPHVSEASEMF